MTALEEIKKAEHKRIWLEPAGAPDRCWCQDNQWDEEGVEYVLASTLESLQRENDELRKALLPFSELPDNAHGKNRYFLELLVCPDGDTPADGVKHYGEAIRTARTALASTGGEHNGN